MSERQNHYTILEIENFEPDKTIITNKYLDLFQQFKNNPEELQKITNAYNILSDPEKKEIYDNELKKDIGDIPLSREERDLNKLLLPNGGVNLDTPPPDYKNYENTGNFKLYSGNARVALFLDDKYHVRISGIETSVYDNDEGDRIREIAIRDIVFEAAPEIKQIIVTAKLTGDGKIINRENTGKTKKELYGDKKITNRNDPKENNKIVLMMGVHGNYKLHAPGGIVVINTEIGSGSELFIEAKELRIQCPVEKRKGIIIHVVEGCKVIDGNPPVMDPVTWKRFPKNPDIYESIVKQDYRLDKNENRGFTR